MRIKENQLNTNLRTLNNKKGLLLIKKYDMINVKMNIEKLRIYFNYCNGFIYIRDIKNNNITIINICDCNYIDINKNRTVLKLKTDNHINYILIVKN